MNRRRDKKKKHDFWKRIHFKYKVSIINENTLSETWKMRISWFSGAVVVVAFALLLISLTSIIIISTPIRNYLPGYLDSEIREQAIRSAIQVDSLERSGQYQEAYLQNIRLAFEGKVQTDSIKYLPDSMLVAPDDKLLLPSDAEREFVENYEEEEKYNIQSAANSATPMVEGMTFFRPVKGLVKRPFDIGARHFGIDMITAPKESVVATLEGTVVFAGYDADGYVIQVQHKNGFISIYKNNAMLLKDLGDRVSTGEALAIVGKEEKGQGKANLHFELWYKGSPVNPENYISF
ncbi:murein hydrolase activator EnvC [Dysgonomonas sp. 520]|uniref:murein hydrolase activator EnvC family protein n=1 Tax=Dysgonomonas sp. 520 TaxID=2302931 RepID=UPI0013D099AC|nr:M23 family metallopeptidase [Dysgonomonas sp. 520]NDW09461.1 M23 family peptidase [Dysgonomonas sp. 520]